MLAVHSGATKEATGAGEPTTESRLKAALEGQLAANEDHIAKMCREAVKDALANAREEFDLKN